MGVEVVAISHSASKKQDAMDMGASHFVLDSDLDRYTDSFDLILNTVSAVTDFHR